MHNLSNPEHTDQLHERHDAHRRVHCAVLSTLRTVFRCVDLMRSYVTFGSRPRSVISPHPIHACARGCLSVFFLVSLYFFPKSFFHLFLIPAMVPDDVSMKDPLCNSAIGSMVSLDYVTPDTEQGSSASQMTAAKIMDIISRLLGCDGQAADAVSAYTQVKVEDAHKLLKIPKSECPDIWIRLPRHKWPKSWSSMEDPVVPLERNLYGHLWQDYFGKGNLRKSY